VLPALLGPSVLPAEIAGLLVEHAAWRPAQKRDVCMLSMIMYVCVCLCVYVYVCMYVCVYVHTCRNVSQ
jgi:heme/copper-type cytochrome/quinol oxidase subunit 2